MFLIKYMLSCILLTVVVSSAKLNETPVVTQLEQQEISKKDNIELPVEIEEATVNVDKATDNLKLEGKLSSIETVNKEDKIILTTKQPTTEKALVTEINVITEKSSEEESTVSAKSLDVESTTSAIQTTASAVTEKEIKTRKTTLIEVTTEQIKSTTNAGTLIFLNTNVQVLMHIIHFFNRNFSKTR